MISLQWSKSKQKIQFVRFLTSVQSEPSSQTYHSPHNQPSLNLCRVYAVLSYSVVSNQCILRLNLLCVSLERRLMSTWAERLSSLRGSQSWRGFWTWWRPKSRTWRTAASAKLSNSTATLNSCSRRSRKHRYVRKWIKKKKFNLTDIFQKIQIFTFHNDVKK